jgi:hypothetical protein
MIVDPTTIFYSGQSLGAIQGAANVATNPRISKAALNVGGGTIVDVFTNSPAFAAQVDALLLGIGIDRHNPADASKYLQFLVVAKTINDPADPINFVGHLTGNTLPNLLVNPPASQGVKEILTQVANCDGVVPNPFGFVYANNSTTGPLPLTTAGAPNAAFFTPGAHGTFQLFVSSGFSFGSCASGTVPHGFLTDFSNPALTLEAQSDVAAFMINGTHPLSIRQ